MKFYRIWVMLAGSGVLFFLTSCDKIQGLADKAKALTGEDAAETGSATAEVESVSEQAGKQFITEESRLVMLEFYTDT